MSVMWPLNVASRPLKRFALSEPQGGREGGRERESCGADILLSLAKSHGVRPGAPSEKTNKDVARAGCWLSEALRRKPSL